MLEIQLRVAVLKKWYAVRRIQQLNKLGVRMIKCKKQKIIRSTFEKMRVRQRIHERKISYAVGCKNWGLGRMDFLKVG